MEMILWVKHWQGFSYNFLLILRHVLGITQNYYYYFFHLFLLIGG